MRNCRICKSKMPDELFVPAFINGGYTKNLCPICTMDLRNEVHGLPKGTELQGEKASELVDNAWEYYRPVIDDNL